MGWIAKLLTDEETRDKDPGRFDRALSRAVSELNRLEVTANLPYSQRRQADRLETEIHQTAIAGDDLSFTQALESWKKCFTEDAKNEDDYQQQPLFV